MHNTTLTRVTGQLRQANSNLAGQEGRYLDRIARVACSNHQVPYHELTHLQKIVLSHYRCHLCGLSPLYNLDITHFNRPRCGTCNQIVAFRTRGKYGRIRKEIARIILKELRENSRDMDKS